jgi:hypothetical protein
VKNLGAGTGRKKHPDFVPASFFFSIGYSFLGLLPAPVLYSVRYNPASVLRILASVF